MCVFLSKSYEVILNPIIFWIFKADLLKCFKEIPALYVNVSDARWYNSSTSIPVIFQDIETRIKKTIAIPWYELRALTTILSTDADKIFQSEHLWFQSP